MSKMLYHEYIKERLMAEDKDKVDSKITDQLNQNRRSRSQIIQTLSSLNVSDELNGLVVVYHSPTHGLVIQFNWDSSPVAFPLKAGVDQVGKQILEHIFKPQGDPNASPLRSN